MRLETLSDGKIKGLRISPKHLFIHGGPNGTRTRVTDVRGRCPRPLDDGTFAVISQGSLCTKTAVDCQMVFPGRLFHVDGDDSENFHPSGEPIWPHPLCCGPLAVP
jgi:hypothetical protein